MSEVNNVEGHTDMVDHVYSVRKEGLNPCGDDFIVISFIIYRSDNDLLT